MVLASCAAVVAINDPPWKPCSPGTVDWCCWRSMAKLALPLLACLFWSLHLSSESDEIRYTEHHLGPPPPCFVCCFGLSFFLLILLYLGSYLGQSALRCPNFLQMWHCTPLRASQDGMATPRPAIAGRHRVLQSMVCLTNGRGDPRIYYASCILCPLAQPSGP